MFSFVDFGNFKCYDKDGLEREPLLISHITKSSPGLVTVLEQKKHGLSNGDFVRF
jgi:hypothetical protein